MQYFIGFSTLKYWISPLINMLVVYVQASKLALICILKSTARAFFRGRREEDKNVKDLLVQL